MIARATTTIAAALALALFTAVPAFGYGLEDLSVSINQEDGAAATQAGSHPFEMTTTISVETEDVAGEEGGNPVTFEVPTGETRDLTVDLPVGFAGDPTVVPTCSGADFATIDKGTSQPACASDTAIGIVGIRADFTPINPAAPEKAPGTLKYSPVYNLDPPPGVAAQFGFLVFNVPVTVDVGLSKKAPYHLVAKLHNISQFVLFYESELTVWGDPGSSVHDEFRGQCLDAIKSVGKLVSLGKCEVSGEGDGPFLTLPRSCEGTLTASFLATSWSDEPATGSAPVKGMSGCSNLLFDPELLVRPTTTSAESPAGLQVELETEDEGLKSPSGTAKADISSLTMTLPEGVTANPSAAEGLGVCTIAQYEAASLASPGCPEASKLGSVHTVTPLLDESIDGSLYLAAPDEPATPGQENPFDSLLAAYMVLRNQELGIVVTQAIKIEPDPLTGRLVSTIEDIPQFPLELVEVRFREGPRAPLVTPPLCGTYTTAVDLFPSTGGAKHESPSSFGISSGPNGGLCPAGGIPPFSPGFEAGSTNNAAGTFSPLTMRITRADGEQALTRFDASLPNGIVPKLAGIPQCSDAAIAAAPAKSGRQEIASPSCPAASQIGRVLAGAGVGPSLTYVPGKVYLAGPFGGHPLSAVAIVPAVAGPFDVGTVVTREALDIDPTTYRGLIDGAASDPIPHILKGIPLKLRDLRVYVDRPEFLKVPTGCEEKTVESTLFGAAGNLFSSADDVAVARGQRYQAADCATLAFKPALALSLKGATKRTGHPALKSVLTPRAGDANIGHAVVTLPPSQLIDNAHVENPCTRAQFAENQCPAGSILGTAKAWTPLLDQPLEGLVYFRSNGGARLLPDIVADLHGQFHIIVVGFVDSKNGRLRTTFASAPDAPVSKFVIELYGGKKGLLQNNRNLCKSKQKAKLNLTGANNRNYTSEPVVKTSCGKKAKRAKRGR
jgi:hypothetical protein